MPHNVATAGVYATPNLSGTFVQTDDTIRRLIQVGLPTGAPERIARKTGRSIHAVRSQIEGRRPYHLMVYRAALSELAPSVRLAVARAEHEGQALAITLLDAGEEPTTSDPVRLMAEAARVSRAAADLTVEASAAAEDNVLTSAERVALFRLAEDVAALAATLAERIAPLRFSFEAHDQGSLFQ